jgi:hypothetical protein
MIFSHWCLRDSDLNLLVQFLLLIIFNLITKKMLPSLNFSLDVK